MRQPPDTYTRSDPDSLVFPGTDGRPLTPGQVYGHAPRFDRRGKQKHPGNGFYKARHQIGRPDFRFHDLRHFAATMAAISGATTKELMQFAGHSDIHVAMRYQLWLCRQTSRVTSTCCEGTSLFDVCIFEGEWRLGIIAGRERSRTTRGGELGPGAVPVSYTHLTLPPSDLV